MNWYYKYPLIAVAIIILLTILGLVFSPLFKGLNSVFDAGSSLAVAAAKQMDKCTQNGLFGKGCWVGFAAIAGGAVYLISIVLAFVLKFRGPKTNLQLKAEFTTGKEGMSLAKEVADELGDDFEETAREELKKQGVEEPTRDQIDTTIKRAVQVKTEIKATDALEKSEASQESKDASRRDLMKAGEELKEQLREEVEKSGMDDAEKAMDAGEEMGKGVDPMPMGE